MSRIPDSNQPEHQQHDPCLRKTYKKLKQHIAEGIGQSRQVQGYFVPDDLPLTADRLNRAERTIPDAHSDKYKRARHGSVQRLQKPVPYSQSRDQGKNSRHRKDHPAPVLEKHPERIDIADTYLRDFPGAFRLQFSSESLHVILHHIIQIPPFSHRIHPP